MIRSVLFLLLICAIVLVIKINDFLFDLLKRGLKND